MLVFSINVNIFLSIILIGLTGSLGEYFSILVNGQLFEIRLELLRQTFLIAILRLTPLSFFLPIRSGVNPKVVFSI